MLLKAIPCTVNTSPTEHNSLVCDKLMRSEAQLTPAMKGDSELDNKNKFSVVASTHYIAHYSPLFISKQDTLSAIILKEQCVNKQNSL